MTVLISRTIQAINKIDRRIIILLVLLLNLVRLKVTGNGEQYLPYAKQFADPDWMPNSFWYNDFAGTRLLFQALFGWILKYVNFEWFTFIGTVGIAFLFTPVFNRIFKQYNISTFQTWFWLQVVWVGNQSFFAGGWMLGGIETKTFAYFFILLAFIKALDKKYIWSALFLVAAMYFHILVGFWHSAVLFVWFLTRGVKFKNVIGLGLLFTALTLPLLYYLSTGLLGEETVINGINTDWIYAYVRNPHHLVVFKSAQHFNHYFIWGILITLLSYYLCFRWLKSASKPESRDLNMLILILITQQLICVLLSVFDKTGAFLKTYPYRTSVLTAILMLINLQQVANSYLAKHHKLPKPFLVKAAPVLGGLGIVLLMYTAVAYPYKNIRSNVVKIYNHDMLDMAAYAKAHTQTSDVFLIPYKAKNYLYFTRFAERDRFYMHKNIPSEKAKIYEWYQRHLAWEEMKENPGLLEKYRKDFKIDYLVSRGEQNYPWLSFVHQSGTFYLYKIELVTGSNP